MEQRTTMPAGVSHDLRAILTRSKLEMAFTLGNSPLGGFRATVRIPV
jgi:hypothetical protein